MTFALVGAMLIVIGISNAISTSNFKERAEQTTATVTRVNEHTDTDGSITYYVYLTYRVNGKTYNSSYSTTSYVTEGTTQTIYYDRNNPSSMKTTTVPVNGAMMAASGIVFGGIGIGMIFYKFHKADEKDRLLQTGEKIAERQIKLK